LEDIYDKLRKIERLIQRTSSEGERHAAERAKNRLQGRISDIAIEYTIRSCSPWQKRLFVAVCNKYGYKTYRYRRQKYTTTMIKISKLEMDTVIWPEHQRYSNLLNEMITEITDDLIDKVYRGEQDEAVIMGELASSS